MRYEGEELLQMDDIFREPGARWRKARDMYGGEGVLRVEQVDKLDARG